MIPPAMRHLPLKTKTPVVTLSPDIDDDAPTTSGTGDSGYSGAEEWKQHMHHPPPLKASKLYQIMYVCRAICTFVNIAVTVAASPLYPGFPPTKDLGTQLSPNYIQNT